MHSAVCAHVRARVCACVGGGAGGARREGAAGPLSPPLPSGLMVRSVARLTFVLLQVMPFLFLPGSLGCFSSLGAQKFLYSVSRWRCPAFWLLLFYLGFTFFF